MPHSSTLVILVILVILVWLVWSSGWCAAMYLAAAALAIAVRTPRHRRVSGQVGVG